MSSKSSHRKALSKAVRFEVFKRDGFACQYCGAHPPKALLHVDHIKPVSLGGLNSIDNLITACADCNLGKAARPLSEKPKSLAEKAEEATEREAQIAGYAELREAIRQRIENDAWQVAEFFEPGCSEAGFSRQKLNSLRTFVDRMGLHDTLEAAQIAMSKRLKRADTWRYFCGICWNCIRRNAGPNSPRSEG